MITFEDFLSALIIATLLLIIMSIPKLIMHLAWTIYKVYVYEVAAKVLKIRRLKDSLPQRVYQLLLRISENPEETIKSQITAIDDYRKNITEPLIEAISSLILIIFIFRFVNLDPLVQQIILWLGIMLGILIVISLNLIWHLVKLADKLLALTPEATDKCA